MKEFSVQGYNLRINLRELVFPLVTLAFCGVYFIDTRDLPPRSLLYAKPILYGTVFFAVAVIAIFGVQINPNETDQSSSTSSMSGFSSDEWETGTVLQILLLTGGYLVGMRIQFVVATFLFLGGTLYVLGERDVRILVAYSSFLTAVVYAVFVLWLRVPL